MPSERVSASRACRVCASVVPWPPFLHAGGLGFGDVLVVGLVLQLPAEVLDGFVQAFFQRHLQAHKHAHEHQETGAAQPLKEGGEPDRGWAGTGCPPPLSFILSSIYTRLIFGY